MANTFKTLLPTDVTISKTPLYEAIPITGTIISGTYSDNNIKTYSHGYFQTVYDYPYASSSANRIFDISFGYASGSLYSGSANTFQSQKLQMYNTFAQVLAGFDQNNKVRPFDQDGDLAAGSKHYNTLALSFNRLLVKDEIKKGSFSMSYYASGGATLGGLVTVSDLGAASDYRVNSPAGEYGILYVTSTGTLPSGNFVTPAGYTAPPIGLIYYQAGTVVLPFATGAATGFTGSSNQMWFTSSLTQASFYSGSTLLTLPAFITSSNINTIANEFRRRVTNIQFNNTTELNSTVYFCRAANNDFNYSSNPTYTSGSLILVKEKADDEPTTYITTVGLYSPNNELLAVAKLSEPVKKTSSSELTLKVRLDY